MQNIVKKVICCGTKSFPSELPEGHIFVYVGKERCKFVLEANYLNHWIFENLLKQSGNEFGYSYEGGLRIDCEAHLFAHLLQLLKSSNPSLHYMDLKHLISNFYVK